ncbi:MAG: hypothetical protein H6Q69_1256 [Firmicutes bacterium]|nr:hypothetical protein [Bacillota bacterium]
MVSWELVPLWEKFILINLHLVNCEHRILFPRLIMLGMGYFSQWNSFYEMSASQNLCKLNIGAKCKLLHKGELVNITKLPLLAL